MREHNIFVRQAEKDDQEQCKCGCMMQPSRTLLPSELAESWLLNKVLESQPLVKDKHLHKTKS